MQPCKYHSLKIWLSCITLCCVTSIALSGNNITDNVKTVHVIFMNHLDVGYDGILPTPGLVGNIINRYFQVYFPRAVQVAFQLEFLGYVERLVYTSHPWLVSLYVQCPPNLVLSELQIACPNATELDSFKAAVQRGYISWHAGPMNDMFETIDPSLVEFGLQLSKDLDSMFNIVRKHRTLSQRDVPGMTKALVPLFVKNGIEAVTVGVNGATAPPNVPKIFNWQFKNSSVIAMWHPRGYPDNPGIAPFIPGGLSWKDCVTFEGLDEAMCFAFRTDNSGPPENFAEVLNNFEVVRGQFPNARVKGSTIDEFTAAALGVKDKLPVITSEIGNTWIQGAASDPRKVAEMREFFRARTACLTSGQCSLNNPKFYNSSRFLSKVGEHTWGLDNLFDAVNYTNAKFYPLLKNPAANVRNAVSSWIEQRKFLYLALDALGDDPLVSDIQSRWAKLKAAKPSLDGFQEVPPPYYNINCDKQFTFSFAEDGSIVSFKEPFTGFDWASKTNPLGQFLYQTYNQSDFDKFHVEYETGKFFLGIGKPNITKNAAAQSNIWEVKMQQLYKSDQGDCNFLVHMQLLDQGVISYYGAPADIWVSYLIENTAPAPSLAAELQWFNKMPTRLPEALFFSFQPAPHPGLHWQLYKMGQFIDPLDVVVNGSQRLHAIDSALYVEQTSGAGLEIVSLDAPIANILTPTDFVSTIPLPLTPLKTVNGVAFNLFNNIWDVNFIFWYPYLVEDANQKFRFQLNIIPLQ